MAKMDLPASQRVALLAGGLVALAAGVLGGLWRMGWDVPVPGTQAASFHGALIVAAFFVSVLGTERAAASGGRWRYAGPACAAAGGLASLFGAPHLLAAALLLAGLGVFAALALDAWRRETTLHAAIGAGGAACGVIGALYWLAGMPGHAAASAWLAFLALTIAAERLELSHLQRPERHARVLLGAAAALTAAGAVLTPWLWRPAAAAAGAGLLGLGVWLLVHDVARRNLRHRHQARFTAVALCGAYLWLAIGGLLLPFAEPQGGFHDAALHAVFLGFAFAMIMGHATAVVPALINANVSYAPTFYAHLALLDASLVLRVAGDLAGMEEWRRWGGLGNAIAIALFLVVTAAGVERGERDGANA